MTAISDLTNEQLDKVIAERRGWKLASKHKYKEWRKYWLSPEQENVPGADGIFVDCPSFTADPRYAMELAKEMQEKGYHVRIVLNPVSMRTYVELESATARIKTIIADTPERAIAESWAQIKEKTTN